jgi:hypothetical protein
MRSSVSSAIADALMFCCISGGEIELRRAPRAVFRVRRPAATAAA